MDTQIVRDFEEAGANSLKVELFRDRDHVIRGWYIGPLVKMAEEFVLPFVSREQNLRAEAAIVRVVEIALAADLSVVLIDPENLWDALWVSHRGADQFSALLDPPVEDRSRRRRRRDLLVARGDRVAEPRRGYDRDIRP